MRAYPPAVEEREPNAGRIPSLWDQRVGSQTWDAGATSESETRAARDTAAPEQGERVEA
jgi:hypothetical protein